MGYIDNSQIEGLGTAGTPVGGVVTTQLAEPKTYSAAASSFVLASAPTDVFTITGSATKTIRIHKFRISATTTSGSSIKVNFKLIKRSTADSGGTRVADTAIPHDSNNAVATATTGHYTANPTLGTTVGTIRSDNTSVSTTGVSGGVVEWVFNETSYQPLVLRGIAEQLAVNFNGASVTGSLVGISVEWSEV